MRVVGYVRVFFLFSFITFLRSSLRSPSLEARGFLPTDTQLSQLWSNHDNSSNGGNNNNYNGSDNNNHDSSNSDNNNYDSSNSDDSTRRLWRWQQW